MSRSSRPGSKAQDCPLLWQQRAVCWWQDTWARPPASPHHPTCDQLEMATKSVFSGGPTTPTRLGTPQLHPPACSFPVLLRSYQIHEDCICDLSSERPLGLSGTSVNFKMGFPFSQAYSTRTLFPAFGSQSHRSALALHAAE